MSQYSRALHIFASYVLGMLKQMHYPGAHIETRFTLPVILFKIIGFGKTSQYTEGIPQVVAAMRGGSLGLVRSWLRRENVQTDAL